MKAKSQNKDAPTGGSTEVSTGSDALSGDNQSAPKPLSNDGSSASSSPPSASNGDDSVNHDGGRGDPNRGKRSRDHLTADPNASATPPSKRERSLRKSVSWNSGEEDSLPPPNLADNGEIRWDEK